MKRQSMKHIAKMFERYHRSGDTRFTAELVDKASKEWDAYTSKHQVEAEEVPEPEPEQNPLATTQNPNYDPATGQIIGPGDARFVWYDENGQLQPRPVDGLSPYGGMNYGQQYAPPGPYQNPEKEEN